MRSLQAATKDITKGFDYMKVAARFLRLIQSILKKNILVCLILSTLVLSHQIQAAKGKVKARGKDPIGWSLSPGTGFPSQTTVGSSYTVTYTLINNLPFAVPLSVSGAFNGGKFTMTTNCNTTLSPQATCLVHLAFQPIKEGTSTAVITMAYHNNRVPLPQLSSTATSNETSQRIKGHVSVPLPAVTYVGVTYPLTFTFANNGDSAVTATAVNVVGFTGTGCTGQLAAHSNCTVTGNYTPAVTGPATLSVTYVYSGGSVPLVTQSTVYSGSGNCHQVSGNVTLPLPTTTLVYADNVVKYTFTNNCATTTERLGTVAITSDSNPTLKTGTDTCSNQTIAPSSSCSVFVSVIPNSATIAPNDLSVTASIKYNNNSETADATTSADVNPITNQSSLHTVMFVNQCDGNSVWYGFKPVTTPDPTPNPSWQAYQLDQQIPGAAPATKTLQFSQYYGGSIYGRTGCQTNPALPNYGVCNTANCTSLNNSNGTCTTAPSAPFTTFEENLYDIAATDAVYDISLINGFNIPGEFRSLAPYVPLNSSTSSFNNTCGNSAGAIIQPAGSALGTCGWSFSPPTGGVDCTADTQTDNVSNYYFVPPGGATCTPGSCTGSDVCGMSWTAQPSTNPQYLGSPINRTCGAFQGYWTLADWTGYASSGQWGTCNLYKHYSMDKTLDSQDPYSHPTYGFSTMNPDLNPLPAAVLADMYSCKPTSILSCYTSPGTPKVCFNNPPNPYYALNSGYNANITNACGCHDWNNSTNGAAQTAQASQCLSFNQFWSDKVYPRIVWLKNACPTAYSYQFDDTSSQFTCNVAQQFTSYQISFCPGGKSGAPGT